LSRAEFEKAFYFGQENRMLVNDLSTLRRSHVFAPLREVRFGKRIFHSKTQTKTEPAKKSFKTGHCRMFLKPIRYSAILALLLFFSMPAAAQKQTGNDDGVLEAITAKTDLYPPDADAKKEIAVALEKAVAEDKRVILIFGSNWCYDCHVLDKALHSGEAGKIARESYLLIHVDIGEGEKNKDLVEKYKIPLDKGVPALAVLKSDGSLVYWSGYGEFEAARAMLKKDLVAFLNHWKSPGR
jgi:thioredoxin-related protein